MKLYVQFNYVMNCIILCTYNTINKILLTIGIYYRVNRKNRMLHHNVNNKAVTFRT